MKFYYVCFLFFFGGNIIAQPRLRRTILQYDIQIDKSILLNRFNVIDNNNQVVAWQTNSLLIPQVAFNVNVYNINIPVDCGLSFTAQQSFANNYKDLTVKDVITVNRYYPVSSSIYLRYKLGDYVWTTDRYLTIYLEGRYTTNLAATRWDMPFNYPSFAPFNEWHLPNGLINEFKRQFGINQSNKTDDFTINRTSWSISLGFGQQLSTNGSGFSWVIMATYIPTSIYNTHYTLPNNSKPFFNWNNKAIILEPKLFYRFRIKKRNK